MDAKHTATPWHVGTGKAARIIYGQDGLAVADATVFHCRQSPIETAEINAEFIVRACNSFDDLMRALQRIANGQEMSGEFSHIDTVLRYQEIVRAALAKAGI